MKETKELLQFGLNFQDAIVAALKDNKVTVGDFPSFIPAVMSVGPAFGDIKQVPQELKSMSAAQKAELADFVKTKFDIDNDQAEELLERTVLALVEFYSIAVNWAQFRK